ncbi:MAG: radical SAM protein [Desulfobacterales bacterium]|nr:radical SAM protein [Desulfobacterales bacterium]
MFPGDGLGAARGRGGEFRPAYERLEREGKLLERIEEARAMLEECRLCPRECGVNRLDGEKGFCRAPTRLVTHSAQPHFGEEKSLVGERGSGTIFFSNCNLRCVFCQNWPISHMGYGKEMGDEELADMMIHLQEIGCHNINVVTPTHVMPNILNATRMALKKGLRAPLVYNTSGYERFEIMKMLDGIVDIYLPDMKFMNPENAAKYSPGASDYPEMAKRAVLEMHRQVGVHKVNDRGVAIRGLMIRHLVMPHRVAGTEAFVKWVAQNLPKTTYVNIMSQYHVDYKASEYPKIWRRITVAEYLEAMNWAEIHGLTNLDPHSLMMKEYYKKQ